MTELRVMEVPKNQRGLTEGYWLRWPELRMLLVEQGHTGLADAIEHQVIHGEPISTREVKVRA